MEKTTQQVQSQDFEKETKVSIASFVKDVISGDYKSANDSLQDAINTKLKSRISDAKDINIF